MEKIKKTTLFPPLLIVVMVIIFDIYNEKKFETMMQRINNIIMEHFGWTFGIMAVAALVLCCSVFFTEFGKVKIGGVSATPRLSFFSWCSLSLTTTCASGLLFWGMSEPIDYILYTPTDLTGIEPNTSASIKFAMETMYTHWTFLPYAIYTLPTIVFAFMYYNGKKSYDVTTFISPLFGRYRSRNLSTGLFNCLTLFCICAGMAGSLGQVLINLSGGIDTVVGITTEKTLWFIFTVIIIILTISTLISGLNKGMKYMAQINMWLYILFLGIIIILGPTVYNLNLGTEAFGSFLSNIFEKALVTGGASGSQWPKWWTMFYWASWMAWMPTSAMFLARISYGRTIRQCVGVNLGLNALMMTVWVTFMSGTAIYYQRNGIVNLAESYKETGPQKIPYLVLEQFPFSSIIILLFFVIIIITIATSCNSTTSVMANLSQNDITQQNEEASKILKTVWSVVVPILALVMISAIGINGVKIIANLGGVVAAVIMLLSIISFIIISKNYKTYDKTQNKSGR